MSITSTKGTLEQLFNNIAQKTNQTQVTGCESTGAPATSKGSQAPRYTKDHLIITSIVGNNRVYA
jgi:hypothetical protein